MATIDVERFIEIQDESNHYDIALQEINGGRKSSHWIWYIFPQIKGLGHSYMSQKYSIDSLFEAKAYWENNILHDRLKEVTEALLKQSDNSVDYIFGSLDAMKVKSCMTLFDVVSPHDIFKDVLDTFYDCDHCKATLSRVKKELDYYKTDSAFKRNGINTNVRGFFEGSSHEAKDLSWEKTMGTLFDLVRRGESMQHMAAYYLWHKDFMPYRVDDVEFTLTNRIQRFILENSDTIADKKALCLLKELYSKGNEVHGVFEAAKYFDEATACLMQNSTTEEIITKCIKEYSIASPIECLGKREYHGIIRPAYTPDKLSDLKPDEVFVFGSNLKGYHGGGAAWAAMNKFGAEWGKGVGIQGQSYAIPTMQGGVDTIRPYVNEFIDFAKQHEEKFFYVTRIGCGIAGFKDEDIAPLFQDAQFVENICLPESFANIIKSSLPKEMRQIMYGQMRTLVDLLKVFNKQKPIIDAEEGMARVKDVLDRNVRYGDEFAFMAFRTIWCLISRYKRNEGKVDLDKLERDLYDFHKGNQWMVEGTIEDVMYKYSVNKMVKYIQFLNDFRRYKTYDEIENDLRSIPVSHCSSNDENYYFSFCYFPMHVFRNVISREWKNIAPEDRLDNDLLEEVLMVRYQKTLAKYGIQELIRRSYGDVGCHPDIKGPRVYDVETPVYGPYFRINGKQIEKGCSDFRRCPFGNQEFEMRFASALLDRDENYIHTGEGRWDEYYIPRQDDTLPVYSKVEGKLYFDSEEEKKAFIRKHRE